VSKKIVHWKPILTPFFPKREESDLSGELLYSAWKMKIMTFLIFHFGPASPTAKSLHYKQIKKSSILQYSTNSHFIQRVSIMQSYASLA
jgi:hypothetical protein